MSCALGCVLSFVTLNIFESAGVAISSLILAWLDHWMEVKLSRLKRVGYIHAFHAMKGELMMLGIVSLILSLITVRTGRLRESSPIPLISCPSSLTSPLDPAAARSDQIVRPLYGRGIPMLQAKRHVIQEREAIQQRLPNWRSTVHPCCRH